MDSDFSIGDEVQIEWPSKWEDAIVLSLVGEDKCMVKLKDYEIRAIVHKKNLRKKDDNKLF